MKSRAVNTTKEQDAFRAAILKGKAPSVKKKSPVVSAILNQPKRPTVVDELYYLDNCLFWIQEYAAGRTSKERVLKSIDSMIMLSNKLKQIIINK